MKIDSKAIFIVVLLVVLAIMATLYVLKPNQCNSSDLCPKVQEQGLVSTFMTSWGKNIDNTSQVLFDFSVYNYGPVEAKNVVIKCVVYSQSNSYLIVTKNIGNIASTSVKTMELTGDDAVATSPPNRTAYCYPDSCDNCEILDKQIPDLTAMMK